MKHPIIFVDEVRLTKDGFVYWDLGQSEGKEIILDSYTDMKKRLRHGDNYAHSIKPEPITKPKPQQHKPFYIFKRK